MYDRGQSPNADLLQNFLMPPPTPIKCGNGLMPDFARFSANRQQLKPSQFKTLHQIIKFGGLPHGR